MRVATWNVENLFTPGAEFGVRSAPTFDEKVAGIAQTVRGQDVEVLAVQEIGDEAAFQRLLNALGLGWDGVLSTHFAAAHPIRVGFAARLTIEESSEHAGIPELLRGTPTDDAGSPLESMGRGALRIRVRSAGMPVDLVSVHLKSKLISYPDGRFQPRDEGERARYGAYAVARRAAEAVAVRYTADELIRGEGDERAVVVLGDFNDEPDAATTQIVNGPSGSEIGTAGEDRPDKGDAARLFNLVPLIPEELRYSRVFRGRPELIDHIFVTNALRPRVTEVTTVTTAAGLASITEDPAARRDSPWSDHALVLADLDI